MKAKILKVSKQLSKQGGNFFYVFFKTEDGKSAKTCVYPAYGNARRWLPVIQDFERNGSKAEFWLSGLSMKGNLIDADSQFILTKTEDLF